MVVAQLCQDESISSYITNLTSSYTNKSNEASMVSASVIMFVLAGLFFNLNLFGGITDVSSILDPKIRLVLSSALSLFLPVMSYLFSEAKNAGGPDYSSSAAMGGVTEFSLRAGLILLWMLLVELLRKKLDEVRMRGYSGTVHRAGRVVWLGSLVFFNIHSAGRKAMFGVLWILCATTVVQRIAFTEIGKRSYVHGKNSRLITSYMARMLKTDNHHGQEGQHHDHRHATQVDVERATTTHGEVLLKRCRYIVTGEDKLVKEASADGYELNEVTGGDSESCITVGKVWQLLSEDPLFDCDQRPRKLCLSFALFKLLRRRFENLSEVAKEEARDCRDLILKGLCRCNGGDGAGEALFQVMNDEVNFLCEYYHSVVPVVLASPFFFLANYFLFPIVVFGLCLTTVVLCGNGDLSYAFRSIQEDNYTLRSGVSRLIMCLLTKVAKSPPAFFAMIDLSITILLFTIFFYEQVWEFVVFLLSNWFMVSLIGNYTAKPRWRQSRTIGGAIHRIMWLQSKMSHGDLSFRQFSVLNLRWLPVVGLPATLSLAVRAVPVPTNVKDSIKEYLLEHDGRHGTGGVAFLTNGKSALEKNNRCSRFSWACESESVAEVILTWHIATSLFEEMRCSSQTTRSKETAASHNVATTLSKYCAYLVAFHPALLPGNPDKTERVFEDMKEELKHRLGFLEYYVSRWRARVDKVVESAGREERWTEKKMVKNGATLAASLEAEAAGASNDGDAAVWKLLADVWTELVVYVAPSSEEERVNGHENVLVQGGEFVTILWALTTHIGMSRQPSSGAAAQQQGG